MTTFDQREAGFENQYAHNEDMRFRAEARRNKLLGLWAAEKLGLAGAAADGYAREVVDTAVQAAGGRAVLRKVAADLTAKGVAVSEASIQDKMAELLSVATAQVRAGR